MKVVNEFARSAKEGAVWRPNWAIRLAPLRTGGEAGSGVSFFVTDRCDRLDDPWDDRAMAVRFEWPEAAGRVLEQRGRRVDGVLALGTGQRWRRLTWRGAGLAGNHPASVEACRNKLR